VGKRGSVATVERFIRSMKTECGRHILIPLQLEAMRRELRSYAMGSLHRPSAGEYQAEIGTSQELANQGSLCLAADGDPRQARNEAVSRRGLCGRQATPACRGASQSGVISNACGWGRAFGQECAGAVACTQIILGHRPTSQRKRQSTAVLRLQTSVLKSVDQYTGPRTNSALDKRMG
jgi:hypothetical protein